MKQHSIQQGPDPLGFFVSELASYKKKKRLHNHGFSLVEIIIVIAIMAILAAAVAPALLRYINKSRKAVDIETAQTIFEAANLAAVSADSEVGAGWAVAATTSNSASVARTTVTSSGHNASMDRTDRNTYVISCVAWARGINLSWAGYEWANARFKSTIDRGTEGEQQRKYTNEFLRNLVHDTAAGAVYTPGTGAHAFDGYSTETMVFKYKGDAGYGKPECWMLCIRNDSYTPEIWIGDKDLNNNPNLRVRPLYRIYPEPCVEYTE